MKCGSSAASRRLATRLTQVSPSQNACIHASALRWIRTAATRWRTLASSSAASASSGRPMTSTKARQNLSSNGATARWRPSAVSYTW
ncbi:hypothetical protein G6F35_018559 [Rhizopus arrhizus]|nr:hypothetical protein G6F35_018559 [Rhizopus arrhizus]